MSGAGQGLKPLFDPQTIAIIGASNDVNKFGGRPIRYMLEVGFDGRIYPVNPRGGEIQGLTCYRDIREVPETVDMTVITVPAPLVVGSVRACAEAGVRSAVIFSSGFAEVGAEGEAWQQELAEIARETGIRLVGPNCMGMLNTHSHAIGTFSSSFEHGWPKVGNISVISQSGAVGGHTMVLARERGLGIHGWMTTGNECDVDVAECIAYCAEDPQTQVIAAYIEGTKKPDVLIEGFEAARRNGKAIVCLKVGASEVGAVAANTHTASLAGADAVYDAIFRQYGVWRAYSLEELLDISAAASAGHFPQGKRLGVVTVSGGAGVISADVASEHGLEVPELPAEAQRRLKELLPFGAVRNPVDTTAQMLNDMNLFDQSMRAMLDHGNCDAVVVFLTSIGFSERMMSQLREVLPRLRKDYPDALLVLSMICRPGDRALLEEHGYHVIEDLNRAIHVIAALMHFGQSFARGPAEPAPPVPAEAEAPPAEPLAEHEAAALLARAGIPTVPSEIAGDADAAAEAAARLGFPVVLKIASANIQHKSDIGGVKLNLKGVDEVRSAFEAIMQAAREHAPEAKIDGVLVSPMRSGLETIMGVNRDPVFGPMVLFGLGGVFVEVLKDVTFRRAPFGPDQARAMIGELKGKAMLDGVRGAKPADVEALAQTLSALSAYAAKYADRIEGIDVNPFLIGPEGEGGVAVDALIVPRT